MNFLGTQKDRDLASKIIAWYYTMWSIIVVLVFTIRVILTQSDFEGDT